MSKRMTSAQYQAKYGKTDSGLPNEVDVSKAADKDEKGKETKPIRPFNGIECDSDEEMYFLMWAFELQSAGYVEQIRRSESFTLAEAVKFSYIKQLVTKSKECEKHIMHDKVYTPDYVLEFSDEAREILLADKHSPNRPFIGKSGFSMSKTAYFEVKPEYNQNGKTDVFAICQKWMFQQTGIYVNLFVPCKRFEETFTPARYLITNKSGKKRKQKHVIKSLHEFMNDKNRKK